MLFGKGPEGTDARRGRDVGIQHGVLLQRLGNAWERFNGLGGRWCGWRCGLRGVDAASDFADFGDTSIEDLFPGAFAVVFVYGQASSFKALSNEGKFPECEAL